MQPPGPRSSLADWLDYQSRTHPHAIELGLDRVGAVYQSLGAPKPASRVITVAGTNGKGSTVAFLESMALHHDLSVGCYTSPHLLRYEERLRINGAELDAVAWVEAFEQISKVRDGVPLTYFEWGTLAALWLLGKSAPDLAVLEVGLGGRLDAVNIVDADLAIITAIDLDHSVLLGVDRESIGREKAGVMRQGRAVVLSEPEPPASVVDRAHSLQCTVRALGLHYHMVRLPSGDWRWSDAEIEIDLPAPALTAPCQWMNLAGAVQAFRCLYPSDAEKLIGAASTVRLPGRMQHMRNRQEWLLDVAHNPAAVLPLRAWFDEQPSGRLVHAVFASLADKDVAGMIAPLVDHVTVWHFAGLQADGVRGQMAETMASKAESLLDGREVLFHADVTEAVAAIHASASPNSLILVYGSFYTVAAAMKFLLDAAE